MISLLSNVIFNSDNINVVWNKSQYNILQPANAGTSDPTTNPVKNDTLDSLEESSSLDDDDTAGNETTAEENKSLRQKFPRSMTFDALLRSELDFTETNDERSNFQTVLITPNNGLRQKHQNMVVPNEQAVNSHSAGLLNILHGIPMSAQNVEPWVLLIFFCGFFV